MSWKMTEHFIRLCKNTTMDCSYFLDPMHESLMNMTLPNQSIDHEWMYGGEMFNNFILVYERIHVPLSLIICLLGVITNASNVIVLTRKSMISPTNTILTGLSVAQLFLLMNYLLLLSFNVCVQKCIFSDLHSYSAMTYKWINVNLNIAFHTTALCHTLVLAIFRFLAIKAPAFARAKLNVRIARVFVCCLHTIVPALCVPTFFTSYVAPARRNDPLDLCGHPDPYDLDYISDNHLLKAALWIFGIFFKLVPSTLIMILSFYLIVSLKKYNDRKDRLTGKKRNYREHCDFKKLASFSNSERPQTKDGVKEMKKPHALSRTQTESQKLKTRTARSTLTKMLVAVALLSVAVELPHGIVNLLTAILGYKFGIEIYDNLGDIFEMLTLLYSSVNFVLYCAMSTEFQETFYELFCIPAKNFCFRILGKPIVKNVDNLMLLHRNSAETIY